MADKSSHKKLTIKLVLATFVMFGFGFALVPLYDVMCDALGINGKTSDVAAIQPTGMQPDLSGRFVWSLWHTSTQICRGSLSRKSFR